MAGERWQSCPKCTLGVPPGFDRCPSCRADLAYEGGVIALKTPPGPPSATDRIGKQVGVTWKIVGPVFTTSLLRLLIVLGSGVAIAYRLLNRQKREPTEEEKP